MSKTLLPVLWTLLVASAVFPQSTARPEAPASPKLAGTLHQRLEELSRELDRGLDRVANTQGTASRERARAEAARVRAHLRQLERDLGGLPSAERAPLAHKLRNLESLASNLERAAEGFGPPDHREDRRPRPHPVEHGRTKAAAVPNDACANATVVSLGETVLADTAGATTDGSASCGSSYFSPDVWFKYVATDFGYVSVDTIGSGFDTVVSVHSSCPGQLSNELTCNDDSVGLQSAAAFYTNPGQEYWIRVAGFNDASGSVELHLGHGGEISGTVTSAATGDPLEDGRIEIRDTNDYVVGSTVTGASGEYAVAYLYAGKYFVAAAEFDGFIPELYSDVPCLGGVDIGCQLEAGTPVTVESLGSRSGIDFALASGGHVIGSVTEAATGDPIPDAWVSLYNSAGNEVASTATGADGSYGVGGLATGSYFVVVSSGGYQDELYDDLAWNDYGVDPTTGTAIQVVAPATASGIDFALDRLGAIEGVVTDSVTGDPISGAYLTILSSSGGYEASGATGADGSYSLAGLAAGGYKVVAETFGYITEIYDDVPCADSYYTCDAASGTLVSVGLNMPATGIDFALDRLGAVTGTVTETQSGLPLSSVMVEIRDGNGYWFSSGYTDASGAYTATGLPPGTYYAVTGAYGSDYLNELYDNLPCAYGCDVSTGTPIPVAANATAAGVDFSLDRAAFISGTVTASGTGNPISNAEVRIWSASGSQVRDGNTEYYGEYSIGGLAAGTYFVTVSSYGFQAELHDDLPCGNGAPSGCDPTTGTPVAVTLGAEASGVDFALETLGSIAGRVTDMEGNPLSDLYVYIWDANGNYVTEGYADSDGRYEASGLLSQAYYVTTYNYDGYLDELYDDIPCYGGGCNITKGDPVAVAVNATTQVDFELQPIGRLSGRVTAAETGLPLADVRIDIWHQFGYLYTSSTTGDTGEYSIDLEPGLYYISTTNSLGFLDEVYDGVICPDGPASSYECEPTDGAPVTMVVGTSITGIDFRLESSFVFLDGFESGDVSKWSSSAGQ